jgi:hypothetical protein
MICRLKTSFINFSSETMKHTYSAVKQEAEYFVQICYHTNLQDRTLDGAQRFQMFVLFITAVQLSLKNYKL